LRIRYGKKEDGSLVKKAAVYTQDEHSINPANVDADAAFIVSRLKAAGFDTYIVGGAVRDLMLGKKPKDFDIVTEATPPKIKKIFRNARVIGRRFRLVHVYFGQKIIEVSTFRSLKDGHTSNTYGEIEEDALRRDFSLNALYYDPQNQLVVDYVGGMDDIKKKRIRPVIPEEVIFSDDPVRMLRAIKYAAATGFSIPWGLRRRIKKEAPLLDAISPSRRTEELFKIIRSPACAEIIKGLEESGLYRYLQAEASERLLNQAFRAKYYATLERLGKLNKKDAVPESAPLLALVHDFLESECDWAAVEKGDWEDYRAAFHKARRFILPMNPPRMELEKALRVLFAEHGIDVKKKRPPDARHAKKPAAKSADGQTAADGTAAKPKKKRRRRKPKKTGGE
jgi:poly(A) polymerase